MTNLNPDGSALVVTVNGSTHRIKTVRAAEQRYAEWAAQAVTWTLDAAWCFGREMKLCQQKAADYRQACEAVRDALAAHMGITADEVRERLSVKVSRKFNGL